MRPARKRPVRRASKATATPTTTKVHRVRISDAQLVDMDAWIAKECDAELTAKWLTVPKRERAAGLARFLQDKFDKELREIERRRLKLESERIEMAV